MCKRNNYKFGENEAFSVQSWSYVLAKSINPQKIEGFDSIKRLLRNNPFLCFKVRTQEITFSGCRDNISLNGDIWSESSWDLD